MGDTRRLIGGIAALVVGGLVFVAPMGVEGHGHVALAVASVAVVAWVLDVLPPAIIGLLGSFFYWALGTAKFEGAFGGFATEWPWFLYGLLLLTSAARLSGFDRMLAERLLPELARRTPVIDLAVVIIAGYVSGVIVPSVLGAALLPVVLATGIVAQRGGERAGPATRMLPLVAVYAATVASVAGYVLALLPFHVAFLAACWLVVGRAAEKEPVATPPASAPATGATRTAVLVGVTLVLLIATPFHGFSPAMVGLAMGLLVCVPGIGPNTGLLRPIPDPLALILAGTALSVPIVLQETGAAAAIVLAVTSWANTAAAVLPDALAVYWAGILQHLFLFLPATPETAGQVPSAGLDPAVAGRIWTGASLTVIGLFQSTALVLAHSTLTFSPRAVLQLGLAVAAFGSIAVLLVALIAG